MTAEIPKGLKAINEYLTQPAETKKSERKRLVLTSGEIECRKLTRGEQFKAFFGCGNASFHTVIAHLNSRQNLTIPLATKLALQEKVSAYNTNHSFIKKIPKQILKSFFQNVSNERPISVPISPRDSGEKIVADFKALLESEDPAKEIETVIEKMPAIPTLYDTPPTDATSGTRGKLLLKILEALQDNNAILLKFIQKLSKDDLDLTLDNIAPEQEARDALLLPILETLRNDKELLMQFLQKLNKDNLRRALRNMEQVMQTTKGATDFTTAIQMIQGLL